MKLSPINLLERSKSVTEYHSPKVIEEINDAYVKIAKIKGNEIPWHNHENEDELFYIIAGELFFEIEGKEPFPMKTGDLFVVKKGVNHKVSSKEECTIMLVENKTTLHTGKVVSDVTKSIQDQRSDFEMKSFNS